MSSGFDLANLMPFYLDETDEQIAGLNEMLLKLEQEPGDQKSLREAFRLVHSIKGSASVMGFGAVKELTHHLETFFDQIRSGKRDLDRAFLDLCFRCLDALRDYHTDLRANGQSAVDLTGLTELVIARLSGEAAAPPPAPPEPVAPPAPEPVAPPAPEPVAPPAPELIAPPAPELIAPQAPEPVAPPEPEAEPAPTAPPAYESNVSPSAPIEPPPELEGRPGVVGVTVWFEADLPWPDMKARLVLTRLSGKGRVLATVPPIDRLDETESLRRFTVWLAAEGDIDELHAPGRCRRRLGNRRHDAPRLARAAFRSRCRGGSGPDSTRGRAGGHCPPAPVLAPPEPAAEAKPTVPEPAAGPAVETPGEAAQAPGCRDGARRR